VRKRITIVEDDPKLAGAWELRLRHEGFDVTMYDDAAKFFNAIETLSTDLVLLDVMMAIDEIKDQVDHPEDLPAGTNTGVWLCSQVKMFHKGTPVVAISVARDLGIIHKLRSAGAARTLAKPVPLDEMVDVIKAILGPVDPS
jgi:DNA-binding response OmpR family regulator